MAIRIPILTSFDPKGLRQANSQFAKLQTSMSSLGRNFAAAGVVIAGALTMIGRSLNDAAESQRVFAQTEAVLKSTGTTANGTASQIAKLAASLQKSTAFNDEAILAGQNLLLTFKGVRNEVGEGNDIFNQASQTMLDFARATNSGPTEAAIKLGKALQDPTRGVTALRKSGVDFTKDQMEMIKSLQESGDLMGAQKIVLAELQAQFGGSAAAYANTFSGQLETMNNELNDLSEEIGFMVMPAITGLVTELRDLIPVIGPQLKAAIESIDIPALAKSFADMTTFLVTNATAITNTIIALFALNTAFKAVQVVSGIASVAFEVQKWWLAQLATGLTNATIATNLLSGAMRLIPFVAVVAGIALVATEIANSGPKFDGYRKAYENLDTSVKNVNPSLSAFAATALDIQAKYLPVVALIRDLARTMGLIPKEVTTTINVKTNLNPRQADAAAGLFDTGNVIDPAAAAAAAAAAELDRLRKLGGASASQTPKTKQETVADVLQREGRLLQRETKLLGFNLSQGLVDTILSTATSSSQIKKIYAQLTSSTGAAEKMQAKFNKTKAGQQELAAQAAKDFAQSQQDAAELKAANDLIIANEKAALEERERVYNSFLDSVKNTFAGIKNSIMGAFDLTQLGGSTNAITRNMEKLLTRLRSFATNVKSLATMGLNPALLQQIISAGPMAGARLAEGLVMGGAGGLSAINAGYSEFGALSGQIAETGTQSLFGTGAQQTVYNINVDGGVGSGSTIGKAIVDAIKAYERTSGAVWQGA
jgi:hypothetical protein